MKKNFACNLVVLALAFIAATSSVASAAPLARTLAPYFKVAVAETPPYAYKDSSGKWVGLTIDLWEQIGSKLGYRYDYVELPQTEIIDALHRGDCDVSVSEMAPSIAAKRLIDFSEPYLASRIAVALNNFFLLQEILAFASSLISNGFLQVFLAMMIALLVFSIILWLIERKNREGHFSGNVPNAVGSALWFGAVTMTSIGYGDKVPATFLGRSVTFIWMIAGMMLIAVLTGTVVSSITTTANRQSIRHISDLAHYKNGVIDDGYAAKTLRSKGIHAESFSTVGEGLKALNHHEITAFIGDSISLQYFVARDYPGKLRLASLPSGTIYRSLGLRPRLLQREEINFALLEITSPPEWNNHIERWTGPLLLGH